MEKWMVRTIRFWPWIKLQLVNDGVVYRTFYGLDEGRTRAKAFRIRDGVEEINNAY